MIDTTPKQFIALIRTLSKDQTIVIREIIVNLLQGNLNLSENVKKQLKKYRTTLRQIARGAKPSNGNILYKVFVLIRPSLQEI